MHSSIQELWDRFRSNDPSAPLEPPAVFHFCDNRADADTCAQLVVEGRKRATATSIAELEIAGEAVPKAGDLAIVTDWVGMACAVIRTTTVAVTRLGDVDENFAKAEGEGDFTLGWWREAHEAYYRRVLAGSRNNVDDNLKIACEHFEVLLLAQE